MQHEQRIRVRVEGSAARTKAWVLNRFRSLADHVRPFGRVGFRAFAPCGALGLVAQNEDHARMPSPSGLEQLALDRACSVLDTLSSEW